MTTSETQRDDAERLSALMDGELPAGERARLLERLETEPGLQALWARYHAARSALNPGAARLPPGFAARVRRAREQEPVVLAPRRAAPAWVRPVAGIAIAASVALVAIGGLTLLRDSATGQPPERVADGGGVARPAGDLDPGAVTPVAVAARDGGLAAAPVRERLMLYLASHSEYADTGDMPTVIPYGRLGSLHAGQ